MAPTRRSLLAESDQMKRTSFGQIAILVTLVLLLILTAVWAMTVWNASSDVPMSKHGWIALGLGTFFR
jgi:hypothetical protein